MVARCIGTVAGQGFAEMTLLPDGGSKMPHLTKCNFLTSV